MYKMKKILVILILINCTQVLPQTLDSPLSYDGGADSLLYKSDTVFLENSIIDDVSPISNAEIITTGLYQFHSPYLKYFFIPVRYSLTDNFEIDLTLPLISKVLVAGNLDYSKLGYGDIKLGIGSCFSFFDKIFYVITRFKTTLPTGDCDARDGNIIVPLGYGSFSYSFLQSFSLDVPDTWLRIFLNTGTVYYSKADRNATGTTKFHLDHGYSVSTLIGIELNYFKKISLQLKGNFVYLSGRQYKYEDSASSTATDWTDLNDKLMTMDITGGIKYSFPADIKGMLMLIFPLFTKHDASITTTVERRWKIFISLEKKFGSVYKDSFY